MIPLFKYSELSVVETIQYIKERYFYIYLTQTLPIILQKYLLMSVATVLYAIIQI